MLEQDVGSGATEQTIQSQANKIEVVGETEETQHVRYEIDRHQDVRHDYAEQDPVQTRDTRVTHEPNQQLE
jgi:hypothetical protein